MALFYFEDAVEGTIASQLDGSRYSGAVMI